MIVSMIIFHSIVVIILKRELFHIRDLIFYISEHRATKFVR